MAIAIPLDRVQQVLAMRIGTALAPFRGWNTCGRTAAALPRGRRPFRLVPKRFAMACSAIYTPFLARRCAFPCRTDDPPFPHGGVSPAGG